MTLSLEEAARRFHAAGLRMTRPREILLRLILESDSPFSVKMLHQRVEASGLEMHLATVHRNLAEFVQVGLLDEIPAEDNRLYTLHAACEKGAHVYCLDCRGVIPLHGLIAETPELNSALVQGGFDAASARLMLTAHCTGKFCNRSDPSSDRGELP
jgi:Fur family ferric uptake transcriptional regulator